jgi:hypothetical protein
VAELSALGLLERLDEVAIRTGELTYAHRLGPEIIRRPCGIAAGHPVPQFSPAPRPAAGRAVRCGAGTARAAVAVIPAYQCPGCLPSARPLAICAADSLS